MKTVRVRADRSPVLACFAVLGTLVLASSLIGCSGGSEGGQTGSGGNSNNGSGGSSSSGGSKGSGGNSGSGGKVGSGGNSGSGGKVGSGGSGSGGSSSGSGGSASGSGGSSSGSGGSSSGSGGSAGTPDCDAPGMIFHDSTIGCLGSGCHMSGSGNQAPDLSGNDGSILKGMKSTVLCANSLIVDPANPTNSVMYKALAGTSCLIQMRVGGPYLSSDQLECVKNWIANIK